MQMGGCFIIPPPLRPIFLALEGVFTIFSACSANKKDKTHQTNGNDLKNYGGAQNSLTTRFFRLGSSPIWFTKNRVFTTYLKPFSHEISKNYECSNRNKKGGVVASRERACQNNPGPDRLGRILEGSVGCGTTGDRGIRLCPRQVFGRRLPQVSAIVSVFSSFLSKSSLSGREGCFCFL